MESLIYDAQRVEKLPLDNVALFQTGIAVGKQGAGKNPDATTVYR